MAAPRSSAAEEAGTDRAALVADRQAEEFGIPADMVGTQAPTADNKASAVAPVAGNRAAAVAQSADNRAAVVVGKVEQHSSSCCHY